MGIEDTNVITLVFSNKILPNINAVKARAKEESNRGKGLKSAPAEKPVKIEYTKSARGLPRRDNPTL